MRNIILVGGIHGVGKTFFCNEISSQYNLPHFSASELISKAKKEAFSKVKKIDNIDKNQDLLISSIEAFTPDNTWFLLDGHFCLLDVNGNITKIPETTFFGLFLKGIIILVDSAEEIQNRLHKRDNNVYDLELLDKFQKEELIYSKEIASNLNIPYFAYNKHNSPNSYNVFLNTLKESEQ